MCVRVCELCIGFLCACACASGMWVGRGGVVVGFVLA